MRFSIAALATCLLITNAAPQSAESARGPKGKSAGAVRSSPPAAPRDGLKTPGVQIPFASLKAEAELQMAPAWIAVSDSLIVPASDGLLKIDPRDNKPGEPAAGLGKPCSGAVSGFNSIWTLDCAAGAIVRLDTKTWKQSAQLAAGAGAAQPGIAVTGDSVWAFTDSKATLSRIDPEQNLVVSEMRFQSDCNSVQFAESALWVICPAEDRLYRVNPATNVIEKHIELSAHPAALAFGENSLWALCLKDGKVERIDPKANKVTKTIELGVPGSAKGGIAVGSGSVWVTLDGFPLTRIEAASEKVVQQFWGAGGGALQFAFNSVWLSNLHEGTLWRIDPRRVAATLAE